jgi:hypothetical protein
VIIVWNKVIEVGVKIGDHQQRTDEIPDIGFTDLPRSEERKIGRDDDGEQGKCYPAKCVNPYFLQRPLHDVNFNRSKGNSTSRIKQKRLKMNLSAASMG